ncbi:MAG: bifunctional methylenetetrahydrofolate dehydrogenase/methenyltetrahydrofolate cyclohydrolase FolD [Pirellulaceae bacterium]|nr:bifunctional methylenetetrahydrofolate dehydrogenase/methenyltetrahydrofolate cyclohydrolase FolD [Thermoguttaceae bacterium]MDI9443619.1 bifunctional methylenetetrahydrofolate dehydrogenase/methenyltetrahydrofolate cyclohydrolase FolD [Planctomycetota bacterium]NLZ02346.1 bifunctional methylenetetrahydrofolate dehydrogenase/methenyltetrahydrofolate cyclohydrolase FolD [Pirellulaceae bacterium]
MSATVLDGKSLAQQIRAEIGDQVADFTRKGGAIPCLAAVLVGEDPGSQVYVRNKEKACARAGMKSLLHLLPAETTTGELLDLVARLNADRSVHGILVQLPLPSQIDGTRVLDAVDPLKDVDAFHPENVGRIVQGRPRYLPCTPHGIRELLLRNRIPVAGQNVTVVGRSDIVGKPMAIMLMQRSEGANATVTVCHSRTKDLPAVTRQADVLVVAIGKPKFITAAMVKPGAVVIDVGINRTDEGLVGDVDFESVKRVAGQITPVPGGVGPLTIAMLLHNTLAAARLQSAEAP